MSTGSVSEEEVVEVSSDEEVEEEEREMEEKNDEEDLKNGEVEELEEPLVRIVVTQRAKEVAWPPPDEKRAISPGDLTGKVRFGQSRRKLMELEVAKFKGSSSHQMRTSPFSAGGFQPGKMKADERWKPVTQKPEQQVEIGPRCTLRQSNEVLPQTSLANGHSSYRMPPGTSRQRREVVEA